MTQGDGRDRSVGLDRYFGVAGRTVLITGATRGIGLAMTEAFADAGAQIVLASNDAADVDDVVARLAARGVEALGLEVDVGETDQLDRLTADALAHLGRIDVLVCNAGVSGPFGAMKDVSSAAYDQTFAINLRHPMHLAGLVAPGMAAQGEGRIILTSSIAGLRGNAKLGVYALTKAALSQLARNLAVEFGPSGVCANAIAPGLIRTSWADAILSSPDAAAARLRQTPLRRIGEPWEIAAAALFLAGSGGGFITGQTLVVDGGTLISDGN